MFNESKKEKVTIWRGKKKEFEYLEFSFVYVDFQLFDKNGLFFSF